MTAAIIHALGLIRDALSIALALSLGFIAAVCLGRAAHDCLKPVKRGRA